MSSSPAAPSAPVLPASRLTRIAAVRRLRSHIHNFGLSFLRREDAPHPTPVAHLAPLHPKDERRFLASYAALRRRLAHPITRTIVVAPAPERLTGLRDLIAEGAPITLLDENDVLPPVVRDAALTDRAGRSRRGWIRQQFIKLCAPDFIEERHVLVMDADTKPGHRLRFLDDRGRSILYTADELSPDYFANVVEVLGPVARAPWSFVAHCMLFDREILLALRAHVEARHGAAWAEALLATIDLDVSQCFSEYEIYGTFAYRWRPEAVRLRYFCNAKLDEEAFVQAETPPGFARFRTLSSHAKG